MSDGVACRLEGVDMRYGKFWGDGPMVLSGVDLVARAGRVLGVVGPNGAGKSTLLALMAGVLTPRAGRVVARGKICPLLHRDAGFHRELTGRENAVLYGVLLGESRDAMRSRLEAVRRESGLGGAFDDLFKTYSAGMQVRLGLSVAASLSPDLLLIDDHLMFGDSRFQADRRARFDAFKRRGAAVVLATHSVDVLAAVCDDAVLMEGGRVTARGTPAEIGALYRAAV